MVDKCYFATTRKNFILYGAFKWEARQIVTLKQYLIEKIQYKKVLLNCRLRINVLNSTRLFYFPPNWKFGPTKEPMEEYHTCSICKLSDSTRPVNVKCDKVVELLNTLSPSNVSYWNIYFFSKYRTKLVTRQVIKFSIMFPASNLWIGERCVQFMLSIIGVQRQFKKEIWSSCYGLSRDSDNQNGINQTKSIISLQNMWSRF